MPGADATEISTGGNVVAGKPDYLWLESPQRFYTKLQQILEGWRFDRLIEGLCARFYAGTADDGSLVRPNTYFRLLMIGLFEGIYGEEGLAWRLADSDVLPPFLGAGRPTEMPQLAAVARTRALIDRTIHEEVFRWLLTVLDDCAVFNVSPSCVGGDSRGALPRSRVRHYREFLATLTATSDHLSPHPRPEAAPPGAVALENEDRTPKANARESAQ